jgi:hypothetical protein
MNESAAPCRQYKGRFNLQEALYNAQFPITKIRFTVITEIARHAPSRGLFNCIIAIVKFPPKPLRQAPSDSCFANPHKPHKGNRFLYVQRHEARFHLFRARLTEVFSWRLRILEHNMVAFSRYLNL